jgi:hypothetical protein|eukprot:TRINITY_DN50749_c0_g1_i1.p2 TRINITY_DN50749_c0_g1~~TRINITY_DN50749_c0_g1_i1.p2  ORF type:complete len:267 (+),score=47.16 TRINITY_DN50749_c0_g1_i1:23-823(+)
MAFVQQLDKDSLEHFNQVCEKPFSEQAIFVLNAFFDELSSDADFIYDVVWPTVMKIDMDSRNIAYAHLYTEKSSLSFDLALHLYELIGKHMEKNPADAEKYARSVPADVTAIVRKKELRDTVDVNCDGQIGLMEYILHQYKLSPKVLMERSSRTEVRNEALEKAMALLDQVNAKIREYEATKAKLEEDSNLPGVKGLTAKNQLHQLHASPLAEELRRLLISAEAAVRIASKQAGVATPAGEAPARIDGQIWWLNKEVDAKKKKYGR